MEERSLLQTQLMMRCARSTVTREMRRNGWRPKPPSPKPGRPYVAAGYYAVTAQQRARAMHRKLRVAYKLVPGSPLWPRVLDSLRQGLSPEQIASTLARMPDPVRLSHETIYTALYAMPRGQLRDRVVALLRRSHRSRRTRRPRAGRPFLDAITLIDQRPSDVAERLIPGHWEGDLIKVRLNQSRVGTLVERTTLFVALAKLDDGRAETTANGFAAILNRFDAQMRRSFTYDQDRELASTARSAARQASRSSSPTPTARGNEASTKTPTACSASTCPKHKTLASSPRTSSTNIAMNLNARPRKTLGWKAELFLTQGTFNFVQHWSSTINHVALGP